MIDVLMAVWFLIAGVVCLNKPTSIQQWLINFHTSVPAAQAWGFFFKWVETPQFITVTRVLGVLCFINFVALMYTLSFPPNDPFQ